MLERGEIARDLFGPDMTSVGAEHQAYNPVLTIFHQPVVMDHRSEQACQYCE